MALAESIPASVKATGQVVNTTSAHGRWVDLNTNLTLANTAAHLLAPSAATSAGARWVRVGNSSNAIFRGYTVGATATTTSPVVRIYGYYGEVNDDNTVTVTAEDSILRLDNADNTAAGITLTFESTIDTTTMLNDGTRFYTDPVSLTATDLMGASAIFALVETAGNLTNDTSLVCQALLL